MGLPEFPTTSKTMLQYFQYIMQHLCDIMKHGEKLYPKTLFTYAQYPIISNYNLMQASFTYVNPFI